MYKDWGFKILVWAFTAFSVALMIAVLFPALVYAEPAVVPSVPDLAGFWEAIGNRHWPLAVGIGLTVVVWVGRNFVLTKVSKTMLPWISLVIAVVGTSGTRMVQAIGDNLPWWQGMVQGILEGATVGLTALGYWDVKQTVKKREA